MIQFINQPEDDQLGVILEGKLTSNIYKHFIIVSAFAKNSGVLRLKEAMVNFQKDGGRIDAYIGLDAYGTSYDALCNLLTFVDSLYIIHDNNRSVTFHPKAYYLTNEVSQYWIALGSNNLTSGGLWTNVEWATIIEGSNDKSSGEMAYVNKFINQVKRYSNESCKISHRISDKSELDKLLEIDLLKREIQLQMEVSKIKHNDSKAKDVSNPFGTNGKAHIPRVKNELEKKKVTVKNNDEKIMSVESIGPSDNSEKIWFETGKMTGGSRNILDLSMLGSIVQGNGIGSRYETDKNNMVLGSVVFFDVDPSNIAVEKDVTINYNAKDYIGCTIKMHRTGNNPNGSWRIQLKGETISKEKLTTAEGYKWFTNKIIIMEKIRSDYYVMSVLPESELDQLKSQSIFVARNGHSINSRQYGLLNT